MIKFLLNGEASLREADHCRPDVTVLEYLRARGFVGTKEGCASGDCGACTAALAECVDGDLRYRPINTCIAFVPVLHGRHLITVEGLRDHRGRLHPVQQAMVKHHGSQCGFCTPGFVMSLFAHFKSGDGFSRADIENAICGNLCRCTGYRPIVEAGMSLAESERRDQYDEMKKSIIRRLADSTKENGGDGENFFAPRTVDELAEVFRRNPNARLLAGGTDLALESTQSLAEITPLIYIGEIPELRRLEDDGDCWILGAAANYSRIENALDALPDFRGLMLRFGSEPIREQATIGGNIANASPVADGPPAFMVLGARLRLQCGKRMREIPLEDFFNGYRQTALKRGEFIESVIVPKPRAGSIYRLCKASKRRDDDIAAVMGAFYFVIEKGIVRFARIAYGGMAAIPRRAIKCESILLGAPWRAETAERAAAALAEDFSPLSDARASADYRALIAANLLRRVYYESDGAAQAAVG